MGLQAVLNLTQHADKWWFAVCQGQGDLPIVCASAGSIAIRQVYDRPMMISFSAPMVNLMEPIHLMAIKQQSSFEAQRALAQQLSDMHLPWESSTLTTAQTANFKSA